MWYDAPKYQLLGGLIDYLTNESKSLNNELKEVQNMPNISEEIKMFLNLSGDTEFDIFVFNFKKKLERALKNCKIVFIGIDGIEKIAIYKHEFECAVRITSVIRSKKYADSLIQYLKHIGFEEINDDALPMELSEKQGFDFFAVSAKDLDLIKFE